jgi:hypothetical protein
MSTKLHFAINTLALQLLLQNAKGLVNVVVADDDLHVRGAFGYRGTLPTVVLFNARKADSQDTKSLMESTACGGCLDQRDIRLAFVDGRSIIRTLRTGLGTSHIPVMGHGHCFLQCPRAPISCIGACCGDPHLNQAYCGLPAAFIMSLIWRRIDAPARNCGTCSYPWRIMAI